jgi:citrate lyase beta subunit
MGFTGKFVIHPSHVAAVNEAFAPSDAEVGDARGLLAAFDAAVAAGSGVATYRGRMIDQPDALQARRVLARASLASGR